MTTIQDEITSMNWDIVPKEGYEYDQVREEIEEVKEFMRHPNKNNETFSEILRAFIKDILELDAGVLTKVFSIDSYDMEQLEAKSGAPMLKPIGERKFLELYARDGASFLKETDKFGFVLGYWQYSYQIPAHPMWFNSDEICYCARNTRSMSPYGFAPMQALLDVVKSLHYSTLYNRRFFEESAIPDGVLSILNTNEAEMKNFTSEWQSSFKAQPHKFAVVNQDIKWLPLTAMQKELEFLETQSWYYKMVISMFGLTPAELGLTEDVNKSTSATQAELSKRKGIRPIMKIIENAMNRSIMPEFMYEGIEFQFIYDDPSEKNQRLTNFQMELSMGIKSVNEVREELGLEPVPWGEGQYQKYGVGQPGEEGEPGKQESNEYTEDRKREEGDFGKEFFQGEEKFEKSVDYKKNRMSKYAHERFDLKDAELINRGGSDRSTYELPDEKIIKIVKTARGLAQNQMEGYDVKFVPELLEKGKDYVVVENCPRDDQKSNKMLKPFQKFSSRDWATKDKELLKEIDNLNEEYPDCDFDRIPDFDLIWGDFKKAKNWGWSNKPYLIDAGTLDRRIMDKEYVKQFRKEWFDIVKKRREAKHKGETVLEKRHNIQSMDIQKKDYKRMNYDDLIAEHKKLVEVLESQDPEKLDNELKEQKRELEEYIQEAEKKKEKGLDDGQYYHEPLEVNKPNRGKIDQPQNQQYQDKVNLKNKINCPRCSRPTLSEEQSDIPNTMRQYRCANCHSLLREEELLDAMDNMMTQNNNTDAVSVPDWSPKAFEFDKSIDMEMSVKEFAGFDVSKSYEEIVKYVNSEEYTKIIDKYLPDLSQLQRKKLRESIILGIERGLNISQIAQEIDKFIKDVGRSHMIARTEIIRVSNEGQRLHLEKKGVKKVIWLSANEDGRLCEECKKMDRKVMDLEDIKGKIPLHPRCRCSFSEFIEV